MTVFLKNDDGVFTRVNPTRLFKSGQQVRILVESNSDGYLYIFHQENEGAPEMIFPDYRANNGDNQIKAHLPMEVRCGAEFAFDEKPAIEILTLVVSRTPITGVPVGKNLEARQSTHVPPNVLNQLAMNAESKENVQSDEGAKMTVEEGTCGMKLSVSDPSSTKLVINQDKIQNRIVAKLRLTHQ